MWFFTVNVAKLKAKHDVGGLVRALSRRDAGIADAAEGALVELGSAAAGPVAEALRASGPLPGDDPPGGGALSERQRRLLAVLCQLDPVLLVATLRSETGAVSYGALDALAFLCARGHAEGLSPVLHAEREYSGGIGDPLSCRLISRLVRALHEPDGEGTGAACATIVALVEAPKDVGSAFKSLVGPLAPACDGLPVLAAVAAARPDLLREYLRTRGGADLSMRGREATALLKRLGGGWATEGPLLLALSFPMGESWRERHDQLLAEVDDVAAAVGHLLSELDEEPEQHDRNPIANRLYALLTLLGLPQAGELRLSDYDTVDPENRSLHDNKLADMDRQTGRQRACHRILSTALQSGALPRRCDDVAAVRAMCERLLASGAGA